MTRAEKAVNGGYKNGASLQAPYNDFTHQMV